MTAKKLPRNRLLPNGDIKSIKVPVCECVSPRGPKGGVCGACSGAIPTDLEASRL